MKAAESGAAENKAGSTKPCLVCAEQILTTANKCTKCGSYQDWSRHVLRWSALLVSIFALAPLWSLADSVSKIAFSSKSAKVEAAILSADLSEVRLAFENSGEISGIVTRVDVMLRQNGITRRPDLDIYGCAPESSGGCRRVKEVLVSPGQAPIIVSYRAYIDNTPANFIPVSQSQQACSYQLQIGWIDFAGSQRQLLREVPCP